MLSKLTKLHNKRPCDMSLNCRELCNSIAKKNCADVVAGDVGINIKKQVWEARGASKGARRFTIISAGHERINGIIDTKWGAWREGSCVLWRSPTVDSTVGLRSEETFWKRSYVIRARTSRVFSLNPVAGATVKDTTWANSCFATLRECGVAP